MIAGTVHTVLGTLLALVEYLPLYHLEIAPGIVVVLVKKVLICD